MATKRSLENRLDGIPRHYLTGRTSVETREAVVPQPTAISAPLAPKVPTVGCLLAPALQELLTAKGIDPKTVRLRGERPNPDDEFEELTIFIEGYRDDEVDDDGELILDETFYSVRLELGDKTIFEEELPAGDGQVWPDEDLDGPQYAANDALVKFGIQLHNDQDNDMGGDCQGTSAFVYDVHRTEVPAT